MVKQVDKKFGWAIKNFSSLQSERCYSVPVVIGDCKWRLLAFPKGDNADYLSLYLEVADFQSLPSGWRRYVKFRLSVVNQLWQELSVQYEVQPQWFDPQTPAFGFQEILPLTKLHAKDGGFLVNDEVMIVAKVEVLEVIGTLDESEESEKAFEPLSEMKRYDGNNSNDLLDKTQEEKESIDVNGFKVLPSQVESVRRIFERHPDIASEFRVKNQHLRTTCMSFLLSIIETLCQSLQDLCNEDLEEADSALSYLKDASFKVDWLEKKLDQVKEKKEKEQSGLARLQEIELQLRDMTGKREKKKLEILSIGASLKFEDVV